MDFNHTPQCPAVQVKYGGPATGPSLFKAFLGHVEQTVNFFLSQEIVKDHTAALGRHAPRIIQQLDLLLEAGRAQIAIRKEM